MSYNPCGFLSAPGAVGRAAGTVWSWPGPRPPSCDSTLLIPVGLPKCTCGTEEGATVLFWEVLHRPANMPPRGQGLVKSRRVRGHPASVANNPTSSLHPLLLCRLAARSCTWFTGLSRHTRALHTPCLPPQAASPDGYPLLPFLTPEVMMWMPMSLVWL